MKAAIILCLTLALTAFGQDEPINQTVEDLLRAQGELTIAHEYAELQLQINRNIISSYIEIVSQQLLDSFMDSYGEIHNQSDETREALLSLEQTPCVVNVLQRWDLQVIRHGQRLSECLRNSYAELDFWNDFVNTVHHASQATTTQVQNAGLAFLAETDNFTEREGFYPGINRRLRILLSSARPYLERFEEFRASVVDNEEEIIRELTQCDRALAASFNIEAREDLSETFLFMNFDQSLTRFM